MHSLFKRESVDRVLTFTDKDVHPFISFFFFFLFFRNAAVPHDTGLSTYTDRLVAMGDIIALSLQMTPSL